MEMLNTCGDYFVDVDEGSLMFTLGAHDVAQSAVDDNHSDAILSREGVNMMGDWRELPSSDMRTVNDRFPKSPFQMLPHRYVRKRWPSHVVLLKAAGHWTRYGHFATLPDEMYKAADADGCAAELTTLRYISEDA